MKKVGILGSGIVGQTLAKGFLKQGYEVMISSRNPSKLDEFVNDNENKILSGTFQDAVKFADLLILAVKGTAARELIKDLGDLESKTIVDSTNPIEESAPENGVLRFFTGINYSLMEELQDKAPKAHFVKAFNSIGSAFMVNPDFEFKPTMFIAGNNEEAKKEVAEILESFGFEVEDMGAAEAARAIEPLCMLWCIPGFRENQWSHAFKLMKK